MHFDINKYNAPELQELLSVLKIAKSEIMNTETCKMCSRCGQCPYERYCNDLFGGYDTVKKKLA